MTDFDTREMWKPSKEAVEKAHLSRFIKEIGIRHPEVKDYRSLYQWSIDHPREFWPAVWRYCRILAHRPWDEVADNVEKMPGTRWFAGAQLNFAENLLAKGAPERPALIFWTEQGRVSEMSYAQLRRQTQRLAQAFRRAGVAEGDRVAAYLPNRPETVVAMLAAASIGALFSSCSPDFGVEGVLDRFGQIQPKLLLAAGGYRWDGKSLDCLEKTARIMEAIPDIEKAVIMPAVGGLPQTGEVRDSVLWEEFLESGRGGREHFVPLPFDHPLYIMYSSGTTGKPKCMVHGAGGTLLQHLKEHILHGDLKADDRIFYYTTCGWMMWNWLVSALGTGATVLLYDGAPLPKGNSSVLFDLAQQEGMTVFGTSAKYLALAEKQGLKPAESHDLKSLSSMLSTGSVLPPESFDYVYRDIKSDLRLSSITGGTDLISCFALGNPIQSVYRGELQSLGLGMRVEVWDGEGNPLPPESQGELVCTQAFPSMPVAFWNDPDGSRYQEAYFEHFPGAWRHGDWVERTRRNGLVVYGRSDATLNPGGVRIGTAEIYRQVEQFEEVLESVVVGQRWEGDVRVVLFLRMRDGSQLDEDLCRRIRQRLRSQASPHHVPRKILAVPDIPRTVSGKISELAVRKAVHGQEVKNTGALANPEALQHFRDRPELGQD
ncbi:MAG TPA: acetoacetate--CoA ligase [Acidobacteriota bacterium]|nr:acetoacetate--CoA ligase [Acidobacteriota bacterium]